MQLDSLTIKIQTTLLIQDPRLYAGVVRHGSIVRFESPSKTPHPIRFFGEHPFTEEPTQVNQDYQIRETAATDYYRLEFNDMPMEINVDASNNNPQAVPKISLDGDNFKYRIHLPKPVGLGQELAIDIENTTVTCQKVKIDGTEVDIQREQHHLTRILMPQSGMLATFELVGDCQNQGQTSNRNEIDNLTQTGGTTHIDVIIDPDIPPTYPDSREP